MGIAIIVPVLPAYLKELTGDTISEAAVDGGWLMLVYSGMQFIFAPLIGNLSDRFGRRPILLASVLTFALDNLICALAITYWMLFVGRVLAGISGASFSTAAAYIADVSDDSNRAKNFGLIGIAFGTGFALGPVLGGLLGEFGPRIPFYGAAALSFVNFVGRLVPAAGNAGKPQPPPLRVEARQSARRAEADAQLSRHRLGASGVLPVLAGACGLSGRLVLRRLLSLQLERGTDRPVARHLRRLRRAGHGVRPAEGDPACSASGRLVPSGLSSPALGLFGYAFAFQGWMIYAVILLTCLEALADPPLRSIASAKVPPSAQGRVAGRAVEHFQLHDDPRPADLRADLQRLHRAAGNRHLRRRPLYSRRRLRRRGRCDLPPEGAAGAGDGG